MDNFYIGTGGIAKRATKAYCGIKGKAKKTIAIYYGVNGIAKEIYSGKDRLATVTGIEIKITDPDIVTWNAVPGASKYNIIDADTKEIITTVNQSSSSLGDIEIPTNYLFKERLISASSVVDSDSILSFSLPTNSCTDILGLEYDVSFTNLIWEYTSLKENTLKYVYDDTNEIIVYLNGSWLFGEQIRNIYISSIDTISKKMESFLKRNVANASSSSTKPEVNVNDVFASASTIYIVATSSSYRNSLPSERFSL